MQKLCITIVLLYLRRSQHLFIQSPTCKTSQNVPQLIKRNDEILIDEKKMKTFRTEHHYSQM